MTWRVNLRAQKDAQKQLARTSLKSSGLWAGKSAMDNCQRHRSHDVFPVPSGTVCEKNIFILPCFTYFVSLDRLTLMTVVHVLDKPVVV